MSYRSPCHQLQVSLDTCFPKEWPFPDIHVSFIGSIFSEWKNQDGLDCWGEEEGVGFDVLQCGNVKFPLCWSLEFPRERDKHITQSLHELLSGADMTHVLTLTVSVHQSDSVVALNHYSSCETNKSAIGHKKNCGNSNLGSFLFCKYIYTSW